MLLEFIGVHWRSLGVIGGHWRSLEVIGGHWRSTQINLRPVHSELYVGRMGCDWVGWMVIIGRR